MGLRHRVKRALSGPHLLAFLPAVTLGAFWLGGQGALAFVALLVPLVFAYVGGITIWEESEFPATHSATIVDEAELCKRVERRLQETAQSGQRSVLFILEIDDASRLLKRYGAPSMDHIFSTVFDRLTSALRDEDIVLRTSENRFSLMTYPTDHLNLDAAIAMAARVQLALEEPLSIDASSVYISCTIGFCTTARMSEDTAQGLIAAATAALAEARRHGAGSVRAFSDDMERKTKNDRPKQDEIRIALDEGQFEPWFQPQLSTDTGQITGFEALARWMHPVKGLIPPSDFLPIMEMNGQLGRLGDEMLAKSLMALRKWDQAGHKVPTVSVNFSDEELRNPKLVEKVKWQLDRFEIDPSRLVIEVLETVVVNAVDDIAVRNVNALSRMGCRVDLDDFGTGNASISSLRRFDVNRLKIDRSFVMNADRDPDQQRMITAILTMAERLNLETLAEGVETVGEHAILAQLGCDHVQGFGIARPMPLDQTFGWIERHHAKLTDMLQFNRKTG